MVIIHRRAQWPHISLKKILLNPTDNKARKPNHKRVPSLTVQMTKPTGSSHLNTDLAPRCQARSRSCLVSLIQWWWSCNAVCSPSWLSNIKVFFHARFTPINKVNQNSHAAWVLANSRSLLALPPNIIPSTVCFELVVSAAAIEKQTNTRSARVDVDFQSFHAQQCEPRTNFKE